MLAALHCTYTHCQNLLIKQPPGCQFPSVVENNEGEATCLVTGSITQPISLSLFNTCPSIPRGPSAVHPGGGRPSHIPIEPRAPLQAEVMVKGPSQDHRFLTIALMGAEDLQTDSLETRPAMQPLDGPCTPQGHVQGLNTVAQQASPRRKRIRVKPGCVGPWGFLQLEVSPP